MQKLFFILLISTCLLSCSKEKQPGIAGEWKEIAVYHADAAGVFQWYYLPETPHAPYKLNLVSDGTFSVSSDYLLGTGTYRYDHASGQLSRTFVPSGELIIDRISYLDDNYLITDLLSNGVLIAKKKFERN